MPRGPAPAWRARKAPISDPYIMAVIKRAGGLGKHDAEGHYGTLIIRGLDGKNEAAEWKASLFRCAHYLSRRGLAPVSISQADIERDGAQYKITFRVSDKVMARRHMLEAHGTDRSKWAYDPRRRGAALCSAPSAESTTTPPSAPSARKPDAPPTAKSSSRASTAPPT